jgi:hypothetical protein
LHYDAGIYVNRRSKDPDKKLEDCTDSFIDVIKKRANKSGFGGIMWIIGIPGAGKSALMCILCNLFLLYGYENRNIALYQAPEKLLEEIQKAVPAHLKDKFRMIETLSEVQPFDILCIDEGCLSADAKDALIKESKNFIASITTLRHSSIFTIMNSLDNGILRGYRLKAQFRFYKTMSDGYVDEVNDKFAKRYGDDITELLPEETIFQITHVNFLRKKIRKGGLVLHLKDYCPWYNDKISRSFAGEDFDAYMRKLRKKKDKREAIYQLLIDKFGKDLKKERVSAFLFDDHIEIFKEFEMEIKQIVEVAKYRMWKEQKQKDDDFNSETTELSIPQIITNKDSDDACAEFFKAYYYNNIPFNKDKASFLAIIPDWVLGLSQRNIVYETGIGTNKVNRLLQKYNKGTGLDSDLLRTKTVYEFWIAHSTKGKRDGGQSRPDIWYFIEDNVNQDNEIIGCGECKLIDDVSATLTFYLQSLGNKKNKKMTLEPAYTYCINNNIQYFPFFLRNPKWANADLLIIVDVYGDNKITVSKALLKWYTQLGSIQEFNYKEFFTNQEYVINLLSCKT